MGFPGGSNSKESAYNVGDLGSILGLERSSGGGHGNPFHYSCLENPMDRGAWQVAVHGVIKSWTWLKWLSMHAHTHGSWRESWSCKTVEKHVKYDNKDWCSNILLCFFFFSLFFFLNLLYNIVLVLPYISMNPPQVYTCSPSWTPLPLLCFHQKFHYLLPSTLCHEYL